MKLEREMDETMIKGVDDVAEACRAVKESTKLQALMQVVLEVGNALNAGTGKGNAFGFKMKTLLKLADLKTTPAGKGGNSVQASTLLHFVLDVILQNVPEVTRVVALLPAVSAAARVSLETLDRQQREAKQGLELIDREISYHETQRDKRAAAGEAGGGGGPAADDDDQFAEVLTEFYNWGSERKEAFDDDFKNAREAFGGLAAFMGEDDAKEPEELLGSLESFLRRFDALCREAEGERKEAAAAEGAYVYVVHERGHEGVARYLARCLQRALGREVRVDEAAAAVSAEDTAAAMAAGGRSTDAFDAAALDEALKEVGRADAVVLLQTRGVFGQPHVLCEVDEAVRVGVPVVTAALKGGGYNYSADEARYALARPQPSHKGLAALLEPKGTSIEQVQAALRGADVAASAVEVSVDGLDLSGGDGGSHEAPAAVQELQDRLMRATAAKEVQRVKLYRQVKRDQKQAKAKGGGAAGRGGRPAGGATGQPMTGIRRKTAAEVRELSSQEAAHANLRAAGRAGSVVGVAGEVAAAAAGAYGAKPAPKPILDPVAEREKLGRRNSGAIRQGGAAERLQGLFGKK